VLQRKVGCRFSSCQVRQQLVDDLQLGIAMFDRSKRSYSKSWCRWWQVTWVHGDVRWNAASTEEKLTISGNKSGGQWILDLEFSHGSK